MSYIKDGNKIIIAISGKQLSGKDFLAKYLLNKLPGFTRVGLGDAIKMEFAKSKGITIEEVEQNKHIYRPELIALGNKGRSMDDGLYWLNKVLEYPGNIIVPDMRVEKEFEIFKANNAIMVRVECDRDIRASRGELVKENDPTECALDNINSWDLIVENNKNLEHLTKQADKLCEITMDKQLISN